MDGIVRIGMIGSSGWADRMYLRSLTSHPAARIVAICGRTRPPAEALAAAYGIPAVYTDAAAMFGGAALDAVVIATPDDTHCGLTLAAIDVGLHVLCDKPLALNARDADLMLQAARARGVHHLTLFTNRWFPPVRYARDLLAGGLVGKVYHAEFRQYGGYGRTQQYAWRFDPARANGVVADLGAHLFDLARWMLGPVVDVTARLGFGVARPDPEGRPMSGANDSATAILGLAGGGRAVVDVSAVGHAPGEGVRLWMSAHGSEGALEFELRWGGPRPGARMRAARVGEAALRDIETPAEYWTGMTTRDPFDAFTTQAAGPRQFIDDILSGRMRGPDFADGLAAQQIIDAAIASHAAGCRVAVAG